MSQIITREITGRIR